jgi:hypothetical protein
MLRLAQIFVPIEMGTMLYWEVSAILQFYDVTYLVL